jgi:hypothetical protein
MACAAAARCSSLNASRAASAAARRSLSMQGCRHAVTAAVITSCHHHPPSQLRKLERVIQYSRDASDEPRSRGVLDTRFRGV